MIVADLVSAATLWLLSFRGTGELEGVFAVTLISTGSLYSEPFKVVRNLINDNSHSLVSGTHSSFPDRETIYPFVVVGHDGDNNTLRTYGKVNRGKSINVTIDVFTLNAQDLDAITNKIDEVVSNNLNSLAQSGLAMVEVNVSTAPEHPSINNIRTYMRTINVNGKWVGSV